MFKNLRRRIAYLIYPEYNPDLRNYVMKIDDAAYKRGVDVGVGWGSYTAGGLNAFDQLRAANVARNPEWFPDGKAPVLPASFRGLELAGEVGEGVEAALTHLAMLTASAGRICNILKKLERERLGLNGSRSTKEALAEEIGDFIICADLVGMDFDIAVWPAVVSKFNATSEKLGMKTLLGDRTVAVSPVLGMGYNRDFARGEPLYTYDQLSDMLRPFAKSGESLALHTPAGLVDTCLYVALKNEGQGTGWRYRALHATVQDLAKACGMKISTMPENKPGKS